VVRRTRSAGVRRGAADGPAIQGVHPAGGHQGTSGRGRVGKARPRSAGGLERRGTSVDAEAARRRLTRFRFAAPLFELEYLLNFEQKCTKP
jgi:hypothetical protein